MTLQTLTEGKNTQSASLAQLSDSVEFLLPAVTETVPTDPGSPAPSPAPAPAPAPDPAQRLHVLLLRWQQEHHAGGHQDVPQGVRVIVVFLCLSKNVQAYPNQCTDYSGYQEEDPAFPRRRVAMSLLHSSVDLQTNGYCIQTNLSSNPT